MVKDFEDAQKLGRTNLDAAMHCFGAVSKTMQAIALEMADYSKKAFEDGTVAAEKLFGAKSLDKAFEIQSDYLKNAYEGFVAEAGKIGGLYTDLAQESWKPFEQYAGKTVSAR